MEDAEDTVKSEPAEEEAPAVPRRCPLCPYSTSDGKTLRRHLRDRHRRKRHACHLCDFATAYTTNLRAHLLSSKHNAEPSGKFGCGQCDYACATKRRLEAHVARAHEGGGDAFTCDVCGAGVATEYCLKLHMKTHAEKTLKVSYVTSFLLELLYNCISSLVSVRDLPICGELCVPDEDPHGAPAPDAGRRRRRREQRGDGRHVLHVRGLRLARRLQR